MGYQTYSVIRIMGYQTYSIIRIMGTKHIRLSITSIMWDQQSPIESTFFFIQKNSFHFIKKRTIYFYLLSLAYILWYYAYWEAYVYYTTPQPGVSTTENEDSENSTTFNEINSTSTEVPAALKLEFDKYRWLIFVAIALALIFVYRYIIRGSLDIITNSIPFTVDLSLKNEVFFLQYTYVKTSKVTPE